MPIYEYRCASCGFEKEYLQKVSEAPMTTCPQCHHETLKKLLSAAGFQLKGTGWYATDFKGSGSSPRKKTADKPAEASTGNGSAGGDKKSTDSSSGEKSSGGDKTTETKSAASHSCGSGGCSSCS